MTLGDRISLGIQRECFAVGITFHTDKDCHPFVSLELWPVYFQFYYGAKP